MNMVRTYPMVSCTDMTRITLEVPTNQIVGLEVLFGDTVTSEICFLPNICFYFLGTHCQGTSAKIYSTDINMKSRLIVLSCNLQRN